MDKTQIIQLLGNTKSVIAHHREKEILRGEKFNVFSILKMETKENETHSAFLCELLNPEGSHLKGNLFLKLFLKTIGNETIDIKTAKVKTEHAIGLVNNDEKTGGRIDIYIWDKYNNTISLENKINASEQEFQIERYCNHNRNKNTVYYLTKEGKVPESCGNFIIDKDFFILSYKLQIQQWLEECMKEAVDAPILRETIKQYLLLIKKLTNTMNHTEKEELFDVILKNHEAAALVASNFRNAVGSLIEKVRLKVYEQLQDRLNDRFKVYLGNGVDKRYAQVWLKIKGKEENKIFFGIQSFAIDADDFIDGLYIGIFIMEGLYKPEYSFIGEKNSNWWSAIRQISDYNGLRVKLSDSNTLKHLNGDEDFLNGFVSHIVTETIKYLDEYVEKVATLLK